MSVSISTKKCAPLSVDYVGAGQNADFTKQMVCTKKVSCLYVLGTE